VSKKISSQRR